MIQNKGAEADRATHERSRVHCANCQILHSPPDPNSNRALRWQISELAEALERCRDKFAEYATLHLAKGTREGVLKAQANADMANLVCGAALASVGRNAEHQDLAEGLGPKDKHAVGEAETPTRSRQSNKPGREV